MVILWLTYPLEVMEYGYVGTACLGSILLSFGECKQIDFKAGSFVADRKSHT
jgi:hypothetical protein